MSFLQAPARVILASSSPRRRELLGRLVADFEVVVPDIDEERTDHSHPVEHAANLAAQKAQAAATKAALGPSTAGAAAPREAPATLLVAADTVVFVGRKLLEKPADRSEARAFLRELSGRPHTVCSALSVLRWDPPSEAARRIDTATLTEVRFHPLSDSEIDWYLSTGEWDGVAGGYRLQGSGAALISSIRGSYTNVVGLPLETLFSILRS
ncbi:MAG: Maf family protein [Spirochaetota bacterium]